MERSKKRKREVDNPRITYHALNRTFDRLFKEESLADVKEVARRKLGLSSTTPVSLAQIRDGKTIDLDDDDDFDAFYAVAHSTSVVNVQVIVGPEVTRPESDIPPRKKKRKKPNSSIEQSGNVPELGSIGQSIHSTDVPSMDQHVVSFTGSGNETVEVSESISVPIKKRKRKATIADDIETRSQEMMGLQSVESSVQSTVPSSSKKQDRDVVIVAREGGGSKNARRRKQKSPQQFSGGEDNVDLGTHELMTPPVEVTKECHPRESSKAKELPFAEQLAGAISKSNEMNQRCSEASFVTTSAQSSTRTKKKTDPHAVVVSGSAGKGRPIRKNRLISDTGEGEKREDPITNGGDESNGASRRLKVRAKLSKADELEAANADVKATALRILAAKRASLAEETTQNLQSRGTTQPPRASVQPENDGLQQAYPQSNSSKSVVRDNRSPRVAAPAENTAHITHSLVHPLHLDLIKANLGTSFPLTASGVVTQRLTPTLDSNSNDVPNVSLSGDTSEAREIKTRLVLGDAYANVDLEALIRGPKIPLMIADITSPDSSDDEEDEEGYLELEEDTPDESRNRHSKQQDMYSSEEGTDVETDGGDPSAGVIIEFNRLPSAIEIRPTSPKIYTPISPSRAADLLGVPEEVGGLGDNALKENDTFQTSNEEPTRLPDVVQHAGPKHLIDKFTNTTPTTQESTHVPSPVHSTTTGFGLTGNTKVLEKVSDVLEACDTSTQDTPHRNGVIQRMRDRDGKVGHRKFDRAMSSRSQQVSDSEEAETQRSIAKRTRSATASRILPTLQMSACDNRHNSPSSASVPPAKRNVRDAINAGAPKLAPTSPKETSAKALSEAQSSAQKLDTWVTLKPSSPLLDADSTTMIDELESSSPIEDSPNSNQHSPLGEPLFILTESQAPFPYSQWTGSTTHEDYEAVSNGSDDEEMMVAPIRSQIKNTNRYGTYRTLTDIASQRSLFTTPPTLQSTQTRTIKTSLVNLYGPRSQAVEDGSDSDSESDPDPDSDIDFNTSREKSHIPEGRRAGAIQKRKK